MQTITHTQNIIEFQNVCFAYNHDLVIKDINFAIHKGDYLGIVGPNGGGKSTLLKLMLGLLKPTEGKIFLYNTEVDKFQDWPKIAYISQQVTQVDPYFPMTVEEIVSMGRYPRLGLFKFPGKKDKEEVEKALKQVEMWDYRGRLIGDLSGGQKQRVFIARALSGEPEIVVLDEPTAGVDINTQRQFYALLQKLNKQLNLTLIIVSHELDVLTHEASEIAYINRTLVFHGFPQNFVKSKYFTSLYGGNSHV